MKDFSPINLDENEFVDWKKGSHRQPIFIRQDTKYLAQHVIDDLDWNTTDNDVCHWTPEGLRYFIQIANEGQYLQIVKQLRILSHSSFLLIKSTLTCSNLLLF